MINFNYDETKTATLEGFRLIALRNEDKEKLISAKNMQEPEIVVTPDMVVESAPVMEQTVLEENQEQQIDEQEKSNESVVNDIELNIPDPVAITGESNDMIEQASEMTNVAVEQKDVVEENQVRDNNIFDEPQVREEVKENVENKLYAVDLDSFLSKSQSIYSESKEKIEAILLEMQKKQVELLASLLEQINQLKVDNNYYANAIDEVIVDTAKRAL